MNSIEALQEKRFQLPKSYNDSNIFLSFIQESLKEYLEILDKIDEGTIVEKLKSVKPHLHKLCEELIESYNQLYLGFTSKSYFHFDRGIREIGTFLINDNDVVHPLSKNRLLFRGRYSNTELDRDGMFHLPFQKRNYATTQRFSISGLPCLYLADSAYVCWEELNRPEYNNFYLSRFEITNYMNLKALDISLTPQSIVALITNVSKIMGDEVDSWDSTILECIIKWPLIFCCSIKVSDSAATFKPEYIIPQYLLEWVRQNKKLNAIKYFSVKTHLFQNIDSSSFINVVIPVQEIKNNGYCSLLEDSFAYTNPRCFADIQPISQKDIENYVLNYRGASSLLLNSLKDFDKGYIHSNFGHYEIISCLDKARKPTSP